jgi:hypothetical protein
MRAAYRYCDRLTEWRHQQGPGADLAELSTRELARVLDVETATISNWIRDGFITARKEGVENRFRVLDVYNAFLRAADRPPVGEAQGVAPAQVAPQPEPAFHCPPEPEAAAPLPALTLRLAAVRERMLAAAKESARDVCLEVADEAKAKGDHELRAQCLDDFIQLEQGLAMVFTARGSA